MCITWCWMLSQWSRDMAICCVGVRAPIFRELGFL